MTSLGRAGIKRAINGPFTFASDGNPLVGPVRGLRNFWVACAVMAGFSQGGGIGLVLSRWMAEGDPGQDILSMDVARFGHFATPKYTSIKVPENYSRRFRLAYPNEELPAARPVRRSPIYERLLAAGAVMGANFGLEHALWFAPPGIAPARRPAGAAAAALTAGPALPAAGTVRARPRAAPSASCLPPGGCNAAAYAYNPRLCAGPCPDLRAGHADGAPLVVPVCAPFLAKPCR